MSLADNRQSALVAFVSLLLKVVHNHNYPALLNYYHNVIENMCWSDEIYLKSAEEISGFILRVCIKVLIGFYVSGIPNPLKNNQM